MASLYKAIAGTVVVDSVSSPSFLSIDGFSGLLNSGKLMMSSIKIQRSQCIQIVKTLSNAFYVYSFGEEPGRIMVAGLLFLADCSSRSVTAQAIADINSYYEKNNVYFLQNPVRISADGAAFTTYLTGLSIVLEQNQFNFGSFSLDFTLIPPSANQAPGS